MNTAVLDRPLLDHPVPDHPEMLVVKAEHFHALEIEQINRLKDHCKLAKPTWSHRELKTFPDKVDYSPFIPFVREQGGYSCGMQAAAACWDILNEKVTPFSPNLSVNRMIWLWHWIDIDKKPVIGHDGKTYTSVLDYEMVLGIPTEGSELTNTDAVQWPTETGNSESTNFRLAGPPTPLVVDVNEIKKALNQGPLRVIIWGNHFVALVGYDDTTQRFKFINSWGDQYGDDGFGYVDYSHLSQEINGVEQFTVITPKSLPVARISIRHGFRQDVFLWIGIEGQMSAKRIWPTGQLQDISHNLTYTVTLPHEFTWPPTPGNRLYLDVYDCGGHSQDGGQVDTFSAAFSGQVVPSPSVAKAPVHFMPHTLTRVFLP